MRGVRYRGLVSTLVALSCLTVALVGVVGPAAAAGGPGLPPIPPPPSSGTPACTFDGGAFPIITGVSAGSKIAISCTGLPALHPFLILQASLIIGIDPKAAALLSGGAPGPGTITGALAALPEVDAASLTVEVADLSGNLNFTYTVPSAQATDPNASCPPSEYYFNTGILGCALAMVDLTTQKPVAAGSAVMEWTGYPFVPPGPSLNLSATKKVQPGASLSVSDPTGANTFWWIATLNSLAALLSGGSAPAPTIVVNFNGKHHTVVPAQNTIAISGATYDGKTLTPPSISGSVTVPSGLVGKTQTVSVIYFTALDGQQLDLSATEKIKM